MPTTGYASRVTQYAGTHRPALLSLLVVAAVYIAALSLMPPDALTHHDTGAKYLQVRNLRLAPYGLDWSINYPARALDPAMEFVPFNPKQHTVDSENRIYLQWPIFLGLLTRIPWKIMGFWGLYLIPLLAGLGTAWAAYRLASAVGVPSRISWLAVPLVGLATPVSVYSLLYFEHTLVAMLVTASILAGALALRAGGISNASETKLTVASAVLLSFAVYFRSELYIYALVVLGAHILMALHNKKWSLPIIWLASFAGGLIPLWAFYAIKEGNILPLHATWYFAGASGGDGANTGGLSLPKVRYLAQVGWRVVPDFLFGPQTFPLSPRYPFWVELVGLVGVASCALAALGKLFRLSSQWRLWALVVGLALTLFPSLLTLLSPEPYYNLHGFLMASPFIVLALWPTASESQGSVPDAQRRLYGVTLLYVGLHALVISALSGLGPISRHEWGQRYLLPAYPAMAVLALLAGWHLWSVYGHRWRRLVTTILALSCAMAFVGVGFEARGFWMLREERLQVASWLDLARQLPGREPLLTDIWWLPLNLAADFYTRPIMLAEGDEKLSEWARQMRGRGVAAFGFMSENPQTFSSGWLTGSGYQPDGPPQTERGMWLQRYKLP